MSRLDALRADVVVLRAMARGMGRQPNDDGALADRLARFYAPQAEHYDRFRERLLRGRAELIAAIELPEAAHVVELGGGTGRNLEHFGDRATAIARYDVVDLCEPLLQQARQRARCWPMLQVHHGDATRWRPQAGPVDVVILSYALTMIPNWRAALVNAMAMLKPGGQLAVVDFHVSSAHPSAGCRRHPAAARWFWRRWFGHDGVRLDPEHLETLIELLPDRRLVEALAPVPYLPLLQVPYYRCIGRKARS